MARSRVKALPTRRKGYRFRSRAEARWSAIFDGLGLDWDYEPEGYDLGRYGWYLPDFFIHGTECWIEVKGAAPTKTEFMKCSKLAETTGHEAWIVFGSFNDPRCIKCHGSVMRDYGTADMLPFIEDAAVFRSSLVKARGLRFGK